MIDRRGLARLASKVLIGVGAPILAAAGYVAVSASAYQAAEHRHLATQVAHVSSPRVKPADGTALGEIRIPRLGVNVVFAEGDSARVLRVAVGHVPSTGFPGEPGNVVLAGHRDTFFRPLRDVRVGDLIQLVLPSGEYSYLVEWTRVVAPSATDVLEDAAGPTLTLVTCYPFTYIGPAPDRFVVRARLRALTSSPRAGAPSRP